MMKAYSLTSDEVLAMSLANIKLYSAVLPSYGSGKDKEGKQHKINGDDIANIDYINNFGNE